MSDFRADPAVTIARLQRRQVTLENGCLYMDLPRRPSPFWSMPSAINGFDRSDVSDDNGDDEPIKAMAPPSHDKQERQIEGLPLRTFAELNAILPPTRPSTPLSEYSIEWPTAEELIRGPFPQDPATAEPQAVTAEQYVVTEEQHAVTYEQHSTVGVAHSATEVRGDDYELYDSVAVNRPVVPMEMLDREYITEDEVMEMRIGEDGTPECKLSWHTINIPAEMVGTRADGTKYALLKGREYNIKRDTPVPLGTHGTKLNRRFRRVEWEPSWEPESALSEERDHEAVMEYMRSQARLSMDSESPMLLPDDATHSSGDEATSVADDVDDEEASPIPASTNSNPSNVIQADLESLNFKARADMDYARAVVRLAEPLPNGKTQQFLSGSIQRPLLFRSKWVKGKAINVDLYERDRRRPTIAHIFGVEQPRPCARCVKELGPFTVCVIAQDIGNGACTNCTYAGSNRSCNFHVDPENGIRRRTSCMIRPAPTAPSITPPAQAVALLSSPMPATSPASDPPTADAPTIVDALSPSTPVRDQVITILTPTTPESVPSPPPQLPKIESKPPITPPSSGDSDSALSSATSVRRKRAGSNAELTSPAKRAANFTRPSTRRAASALARVSQAIESRPQSKSLCVDLISDDIDDDQIASSSFKPQTPSVQSDDSTSARFRHPGCALSGKRCTNADVSYPSHDMPSSSSSRWQPRGYIPPNTIFGAEPPTRARDEQVRYLLACCDCATTQRFADLWAGYNDYRRRHGRTGGHERKESFLSKMHHRELNNAVQKFLGGDLSTREMDGRVVMREILEDGKTVICIDD